MRALIVLALLAIACGPTEEVRHRADAEGVIRVPVTAGSGGEGYGDTRSLGLVDEADGALLACLPAAPSETVRFALRPEGPLPIRARAHGYCVRDCAGCRSEPSRERAVLLPAELDP